MAFWLTKWFVGVGLYKLASGIDCKRGGGSLYVRESVCNGSLCFEDKPMRIFARTSRSL